MTVTTLRTIVAAAEVSPPRIVNLSELAPQWNWVGPAFHGTGQDWRHVSNQDSCLPSWLPRRTTLTRVLAARQSVALLGNGPSVLVTHGPRPAMYGALLAGRRFPHMRHLAFSFNYTELPTGLVRRLMTRAFRSVERFVVFSGMERSLYADHFDLPVTRFDMVHWGVRAPDADCNELPAVQGKYICALGSQGRDYRTLMLAMRRLPRLKLILVATPENLRDLAIPSNVTAMTNIPLAQAMNILSHSRFMVLPLRHNRVPCGHVSIVSAMHLGRAVIASSSSGLDDYITPQATGLTFPAGDDAALAAVITTLHDDPALARHLGLGGQRFAREYCTEENIVGYLRRFLLSDAAAQDNAKARP